MASNHIKSDFATFAALDELPPELYREVCFAARVWDAPTVRDIYNREARSRGAKGAIGWLVASIQAADEQDLMAFAFRYQARYRIPLPHFAAQATILRYQLPVEVRNRHRRPSAVPLHARTAWRASERLMPEEGIPEKRSLFAPEYPALQARIANLDLDRA